jgi:hypothetical protein
VRSSEEGRRVDGQWRGRVGEQGEGGEKQSDGCGDLAGGGDAGDVVERWELLRALQEDDDQAEEELRTRGYAWWGRARAGRHVSQSARKSVSE